MFKFPGSKVAFILILTLFFAFFCVPSSRFPGKERPFLPELTIHLGLDLKGGSELRYELPESEITELGLKRDAAVSETIDVIEQRIFDSGVVKDAVVQREGTNNILVQLPGLTATETDRVKELITALGNLEFRLVAEEKMLGEEKKRKATMKEQKRPYNPPPLYRWYKQKERGGKRDEGKEEEILLKVRDNYNLTGKNIKRVYATSDDKMAPAIGFEFQDNYKKRFEQLTRDHKGERLATVLNGVVILAPVIEDVIPGNGIIRGDFTSEQIKGYITMIQSGSIDIKPILKSESVVGPSVGEDAIRKGTFACILAVAVILAFMIVYYWIPGFVSILALAINIVILYGAMVLTGATLTLPGIAGIVLTIGMAVDANILIYERLREEQHRRIKEDSSASTLSAVIDAAFDRASTTIVDSNLTTLIAAIFLYIFGTSAVQSFAITLSIGILASMFTAIYVSRTVFDIMLSLGRARKFGLLQLFPSNLNLPIMGWRQIFYALSACLVIGSFSFFLWRGQDNYGIDLVGGARVHMKLAREMSIDEVRGRIGNLKKYKASVQTLRVTQDENASLTDRTANLFRELASSRTSWKEYVIVVRNPNVLLSEKVAESEIVGLRKDLEATFKAALDPETPFPAISGVGGAVAQTFKRNAIIATVLSWLGIIVYVYFRFHHISFGIAGVLCLVHDTLVSLGFLAVAAHFGIVDVEVDLTIIAAILTIIGWSINDTIVVFDRIRENMAKSKGDRLTVFNEAINQTLPRTFLTSLTVFLVSAIMFLINYKQGNVLEGFGFMMAVGSLVGTYSSIYVATPLLTLWKSNR